jgi:hypothetical protein
VGCEQRSDDDRRNDRIAKTEAQQGAEEQWHGGGKKPEGDRPGLGLAEEGNVDLEPGGKHQQQLAQLGKEVRNRPMLTEEAQHVRPQSDPEKQQADHWRQFDAGRQPGNADDGRDNDRELSQIRQRQDV